MEKRFILHLLTPELQASPFDINMAYDAGFDAVPTYTQVAADRVTALVQDAIFSRGPKGVRRTGVFIGGRSIELAVTMQQLARTAMVPPFEVSVLADPGGAYTTAAAMVAMTGLHLQQAHHLPLAGRQVLVLSGTGPVGLVTAVLAAQAGARVSISSSRGSKAATQAAQQAKALFDVELQGVSSATEEDREHNLQEAEIILATGKAGVCQVSQDLLAHARCLLVAADINAVPPQGIQGIGLMDAGTSLKAASGRAIGIGPLAIGNLKYQVQQALLMQMRNAEKAVFLDFSDAYRLAQENAK